MMIFDYIKKSIQELQKYLSKNEYTGNYKNEEILKQQILNVFGELIYSCRNFENMSVIKQPDTDKQNKINFTKGKIETVLLNNDVKRPINFIGEKISCAYKIAQDVSKNGGSFGKIIVGNSVLPRTQSMLNECEYFNKIVKNPKMEPMVVEGVLKTSQQIINQISENIKNENERIKSKIIECMFEPEIGR